MIWVTPTFNFPFGINKVLLNWMEKLSRKIRVSKHLTIFTNHLSLFRRRRRAPPGPPCRPSLPGSNNPSSPSASVVSPARRFPERQEEPGWIISPLQSNIQLFDEDVDGRASPLTFTSFSTRPSSPSLMTRVIISARSPALWRRHRRDNLHLQVYTVGGARRPTRRLPWRASSPRRGSCLGLPPCCHPGTSCVRRAAWKTRFFRHGSYSTNFLEKCTFSMYDYTQSVNNLKLWKEKYPSHLHILFVKWFSYKNCLSKCLTD